MSKRKLKVNTITEESEGKIFGKWLVLKYINKTKCLCECQCEKRTIKEVSRYNLFYGTSLSCGCFAQENLKERATKHSLSSHIVYKLWIQIKARCLNKNNSGYKNYGQRGIQVCERWLDFNAFWKDFGHTYPGKGFSIDRIDVNGNYEPENVKWSTSKEQSRNKTTTKLLTFNNETRCLKDWADYFNIPSQTFGQWFHKYGEEITFDRALEKILIHMPSLI